MHRRPVPFRLAALALALALATAAQAEPVGSAFTYQGELRTAGAPSAGPHDFQVVLYDAESGGSQIAAADVADAAVEQGLFSLPLDFTGVPFEAGLQYWIELRVRAGADAGPYTTLLPRQRLTATPYALNALSVRTGAVGADQIDPTQVQQRVAGACGGNGQSIKSIAADGSVTCETASAGNPGTIEGVTAGTGLAGGGASGTVTLSIAPGGVGANQIDEVAVQRRVAGACGGEGESIKSIAVDGSVTCETDEVGGAGTITEVAAGTGLAGGGAEGAVTLSIAPGGVGANEVDAATVQLRVASSCATGSSIRAIAADGTSTCEPDDVGSGDITSVTAGFGLTGGGDSGNAVVSVDTAVVQRRVGASCPPDQSIRSIAEDGTIDCETDAVGFTGWQIVTVTRQYFGGTVGSSTANAEARCPIGKFVIGGGVNSGCIGAYVDETRPTHIPGPITTSGWWGHVAKPNEYGCADNPATMTVYAICANPN